MLNIRITKNRFSFTHAVKFEATHGDKSTKTVTIEAKDKAAATLIHNALRDYGSFAYTDSTR